MRSTERKVSGLARYGFHVRDNFVNGPHDDGAAGAGASRRPSRWLTKVLFRKALEAELPGEDERTIENARRSRCCAAASRCGASWAFQCAAYRRPATSARSPRTGRAAP